MNGLELCEKFYKEVGRPMLEKKFPDVLPRIAAGLSGEGSECFGYDDEISHDHDFGPGFCIWLNDEDYKEFGNEIQKEYSLLPKSFDGFPERNETFDAGKRVGVMSIESYFSKFLGAKFLPENDQDWLYYEECLLATAVNGEVFEDNLGEFSRIRSTLSFYPENIRLQKIAASVHLLSQAGQYNYDRSLKRGEKMAAIFSINRFIEESVHLSHLLSRKYEPYYKWAWKSFVSLPDTDEISSLLSKLPEYAVEGDTWRTHIIIEKICSHYVRQLQSQRLTSLNDSLLEAHVHEILKRIKN